MQLTKWHPLQQMNEILRQYTWQFEAPSPALPENAVQWSPLANISESAKQYLITVELPDLDRDDIYVAIKDGALTIAGERKQRKQDEGKTGRQDGNCYGKFSRTFVLPANTDESRLVVDYKNGVLRIQVSSNEETAPVNPVDIQAS